MNLKSLFILLFLLSALNFSQTINKSYRIKDEISLTSEQNGVTGKLQLLVDSILPNHPDPIEFEKYKPAVIRILNENSIVIYSDTLEKPSASLKKVIELSTWNSLSVDYSAGFGSYSGETTSFVRIRNSKFEWLQSVDRTTGKSEKITIMSSLKTSWRIDTSKGLNNLRILEVSCRPIFDKEIIDEGYQFELIYTTFYKQKKRWIRAERKEKGCWEEGQDFPNVSKFNF